MARGWRERRERRDTVVGRARRRDRQRRLRSSVTGVAALVGAPVLVGVILAVLAVTDSGGGRDRVEPPSAGEDTTFTDAGPLTVATSQNMTVADCLAVWLVPRSPAELAFSDEMDGDWSEHPAGEGGVPASPHQVFATVQGTSDTQVVLTEIDVHVRRRGEAPAGTVLQGRGCGPGAFRWLAVDLDDPAAPPVPKFDELSAELAGASEAEMVPIRFPYEVSRTDAETFLIQARTEDCDCEWWLDLHWQAAGETGVVRIDDSGDPFRTFGTSRAFVRCDHSGMCGSWSSGQ